MSQLSENELTQFLATLISDVLSADVDANRPEALLIEEYGANSMDMVDIVERIERKLKVRISNDQVLEMKTFGDVVNVVSVAPPTGSSAP